MDNATLPDTIRSLDIHITLTVSSGLEIQSDETEEVSYDDALRLPRAFSPPAGAAEWMSRLSDDALISDLSIPGTHDSCARSNFPYVRTQDLKIPQQLELGIRALDLRLRRNRNDGQLYCYHGGVPLGPALRALPLADVMADVWAFLKGTGRTEAVLILINNDDPADARDHEGKTEFYRAVADFLASTPPWPSIRNGSPAGPRWFAEPRTPRLGEVRGRAVLMRRFDAPPPPAEEPAEDSPPLPALSIGLDLSAWVNDSADFTIVTPHGRFRVQDKWDFSGRISLKDLVAVKSQYVQSMLDLAAAQERPSPPIREEDTVRRSDWFINFCSAVGEPYLYGEVAEARSVAVGAYTGWSRTWVDGINVLTGDYLRRLEQQRKRARGECSRVNGQSGSLGIVYMDYPELPKDSNLVAQIIETNF